MRLGGSSSELQEHVIAIPGNGVLEVARVPLPGRRERDPSKWLYAAAFRRKGISDEQPVWLLPADRALASGKPMFRSKALGRVLELEAAVHCHGVHLDDEGAGVPADNYLDLLSGVSYHIGITQPAELGRYQLSAVLPFGAHV